MQKIQSENKYAPPMRSKKKIGNTTFIVNSFFPQTGNVERFLSVVERYTEIPELTPCILHEFVEKIVVHAASDPKGKNRTQEIDIYYKGIGALEVSKVTSSRQE